MSKRELLGFAKVLVVFVAIWIFAFVYSIVGCVNVERGEMSPTISKGRKLMEPGIHDATRFNYDDIVVYSYSARNKMMTTAARVIGLPGDLVRMEDGSVFVNGREINSEYVSPAQATKDDYEAVMIPRSTLFVLCDARRIGARIDSRAIGPIGEWSIIGRLR